MSTRELRAGLALANPLPVEHELDVVDASAMAAGRAALPLDEPALASAVAHRVATRRQRWLMPATLAAAVVVTAVLTAIVVRTNQPQPGSGRGDFGAYEPTTTTMVDGFSTPAPAGPGTDEGTPVASGSVETPWQVVTVDAGGATCGQFRMGAAQATLGCNTGGVATLVPVLLPRANGAAAKSGIYAGVVPAGTVKVEVRTDKGSRVAAAVSNSVYVTELRERGTSVAEVEALDATGRPLAAASPTVNVPPFPGGVEVVAATGKAQTLWSLVSIYDDSTGGTCVELRADSASRTCLAVGEGPALARGASLPAPLVVPLGEQQFTAGVVPSGTWHVSVALADGTTLVATSEPGGGWYVLLPKGTAVASVTARQPNGSDLTWRPA